MPIEIDNRSTREVLVQAERGSLRQRVGLVPGLSRARLRIPTALTIDPAPFYLFVTAVGGGDSYRSDPILPQPGERIVLSVQPRLSASAVRIE